MIRDGIDAVDGIRDREMVLNAAFAARGSCRDTNAWRVAGAAELAARSPFHEQAAIRLLEAMMHQRSTRSTT